MFIFALASAALGAILGSFINALSLRYHTGTSVLCGRSRCMHCAQALGALDLVPIFSFAFLRGKCRFCSSLISWQYPLVEAAGAVLLFGVFLAHKDPLSYVFWLFVWMTVLFIVAYDIRHMIIPWEGSIFLVCLALFGFALGIIPASTSAFVAGPALAAPLFLFSLFSRGRWMGWGDSLLELSLGWLLGFWAGLSALILAFWTGASVGIMLLALSRLKFFGYTIKSEMPFAPFLALGAALAYFFHVNLFSYISFF